MANILPKDKQIAVISALAEGSSIRAISRITGVHQDTICRLGVRVGQGCAKVLDQKMRDLTCRFLQFDEIWGFIGKKENIAYRQTIRRSVTCGHSARLTRKQSSCPRTRSASVTTPRRMRLLAMWPHG